MTATLGSGALAPLQEAAGVRVTRASDLTTGRHPLLPGLEEVLGPGGLRRGVTYSIEASMSLCLAMLAAHSQSGGWSAAVGIPTIGTQAAAGLGIRLDRLALIPRPGRHWLDVVTVLSDAVDLIVVHPAEQPSAGALHRLAARLRSTGSTLIVHGQSWPGSELRLTVSDSTWLGMRPDGLGTLSARHATVTSVGKHGASTVRMWLPDPTGQVRPYDDSAAPSTRVRPYGDPATPAARARLRAVR